MRFHVGLSFRLKSLKKFLFPILIGILAYFGFGGLFGFIGVNAQVNYESQYNLSYGSFYENESYYHANDSLTFVLYNILNNYRNTSSRFDMIITFTDSTHIGIFLINKNSTIVKNVSIYGYVQRVGVQDYMTNFLSTSISYSGSSDDDSYYFTMPFSSNINVLSSEWYQSLIDCISSDSACSLSGSGIGFSYNSNNSGNINLFSPTNKYGSPYINNNSNYSFSNVTPFYYSSFDVNFRPSSSIVENGSYFVKNINFITSSNSYLYEVGSKIYSYFDIVNGNTNGNTNFENYNKLGKLFVGGVSKNNISNFKIDLSYNYESYDYASNLSYNILYFGRKDNTTYYSYDLLNCSSINSSVASAYDNTNKSVNTSILPYGFSCISDLTDYDNIYLYIEVIPSGNYDDTIYNLQYTSNYGYMNNLNPILTTSSGFYIYEKFVNLNPDFEILLSTKDSSNNAYYISDNKYILAIPVNRTNNILGSVTSNPISFGSIYNTNAMIFNLPRYYSGVSNLDLFIHYNTIISIGDNNNFTYYDSSNSLTTSEIINNKIDSIDTNNYNMSYYFGVVNDYIGGLSASIIAFSSLTQTFYNSMPEFFQLFIFVSFILVCLYFTYLLIRK